MSRSLSRLQEILLGLAVLAGLGLAGFFVYAVGGRQGLWADHFHVRAGFREIHGVERGTRVRVLGRDAGEVERIDLPATPGGEVVLRLRLDGAVRHLVRADARAQIAAEGLIGGKVVEIRPGSDGAAPVAEDATIAALPTPDPLGQVAQVLESLNQEKGKLHEVVDNSNRLLLQGQKTMASIQDVAEGVKKLPVVRRYMDDPQRLLYRPECERSRKVLAAGDLFEPGRAVLTDAGKEKLTELVPWLAELTRRSGAEVVVASFADPASADQALARQLTQQQSEAVCGFLKDHGAVHKKLWVLPRKMTPYGFGTATPPVPEPEPGPAARVEVLVFTPQG